MRISVVIPVYNVADMLEACVQSALSQTLPPEEVFIVDNGSSDDSLDIAHRLAETHPGIVTVLQETMKGAPYARNRGLEEATSEWIQFLDADDLLHPGKFKYQISLADQNTAFVVGPVVYRTADGIENPFPITPSWEGLFLGGGAMGLTSSNLWKTDAVRSIGGWDTTLGSTQEYDLMFRLLQAGYQFELAPQISTICRLRSGQISAAPYEKRLAPILSFQTRMLAYLIEAQVADSLTLRRCLKVYFRRYTHLRDRDPRGAEDFRNAQMNRVITSELVRRHLIIRFFKLRSDLLSSYRRFRKRVLKKPAKATD